MFPSPISVAPIFHDRKKAHNQLCGVTSLLQPWLRYLPYLMFLVPVSSGGAVSALSNGKVSFSCYHLRHPGRVSNMKYTPSLEYSYEHVGLIAISTHVQQLRYSKAKVDSGPNLCLTIMPSSIPKILVLARASLPSRPQSTQGKPPCHEAAPSRLPPAETRLHARRLPPLPLRLD
jgi:hypothetical protein